LSNDYLLIPDPHAYPNISNERADWVGQLIVDLKPDVVVNGGDQFDMTSLSSYDKGKRAFHGKSYKADIEVGQEFSERMWAPMKAAKKKRPYRIVLEGNHEHRVEYALDLSPELTGTIGFHDYQFDDYYDEVIRYDGGLPGILERDGILFAHFFPTGISGRPIGGERSASMLVQKNNKSTVAFHSHILDFYSRKTLSGEVLNGVVAGCFHEHAPDWAGVLTRYWRPGVALLRNVNNGNFDFQWISMEALKKEYKK
jgi:hypothetical protein